MGEGGSVRCRMLGIYYLLNLAKPVKFPAEPDTRVSLLSFPLGVYSFLKRSKTVLVRLTQMHIRMLIKSQFFFFFCILVYWE